MSAGGSKSLAKAAREAIDRGDHGTALRLCNTGLDEDPSNYMLLVLKGLALKECHEVEASALAYSQATIQQPDQPLAWQGLASLWEERAKEETDGGDGDDDGNKKRLVFWSRVVEALQRLLRIFREDSVKLSGYMMRLLPALEGSGKLEEMVNLLCQMRTDTRLSLDYSSLELLDREITIREELERRQVEREVEAARFRLGADPLPILQSKTMANVYSRSPVEALMQERLRMQSDRQMAERLLERLEIKIPAVSDNPTKEALRDLFLSVAAEYSESIQRAKKALVEYSDIDEEMDFAVMEGEGPLATALRELQVTWQSGEWEKVLQLQEKIKIHISRLFSAFGISMPILHQRIERIHGLALARSGHLREAIPILQPFVIKRDVECMNWLVYCLRETKNIKEAISVMNILLLSESDSLELKSDLGWLYYLNGQLDQAEEELQGALKMFESKVHSMKLKAQILIRLGEIRWHSHNPDVSLFMEAAECDENCALAFAYLGRYYETIVRDLKRAERCYLKSLSLDAHQLDIALSLSAIWMGEEKTVLPSQLIQLLEPFIVTDASSITNNNETVTSPKYAPAHLAKLWQFLGLAYSLAGTDKTSEAISAFQMALKSPELVDEQRCWLGLAAAYRQDGKYHAARQAFQKVLEKWPNNEAAIWGLAMVHAESYEYSMARKMFLSLTQSTSNNKLVKYYRYEALKMGKFQAQSLLHIGCVNEALKLLNELVEEAIECITQETSNPAELSLVSRLLADLLVLPLLFVPLQISNHSIIKIDWPTRQALLSSEACCILKELLQHLESLSPTLRQILETIFSCHLTIISTSTERLVVNHTWAALAGILLHTIINLVPKTKSFFLLKAGEFLQRARGIHGCQIQLLRGLYYYVTGDYGRSQHYLIKALQEGAGAGGWIALARLYRRVGEDDLARKALSRILIEFADSKTEQGVTLAKYHRHGQISNDFDTTWALSWAWIYEAELDRETGQTSSSDNCDAYEMKVIQASQLSPPSAHSIHGLAINVILRQCNPLVPTSMLRLLAKRRMAFGAVDDNLVNRISTMKFTKTMPRNEKVIEMAIAIVTGKDKNQLQWQDQLNELNEDDEDSLFLLNALQVYNTIDSAKSDIGSVKSGIDSVKSDIDSSSIPLTDWEGRAEYQALEKTIQFFEQNHNHLFNPQLWIDLQYWYQVCIQRDLEMVSHRRLVEWLRMRVTLDMVGKMGNATIATIILDLWGNKIAPEELKVALTNLVLFYRDLSV